MRQDDQKEKVLAIVLGCIPVIYFALKAAPYFEGGLPGILEGFSSSNEKPLSFTWTKDSLKVICIFIGAYLLGIGIFLSSGRNYRRGEEHGSAQWGNISRIAKKYQKKNSNMNIILTQNLCISFNMRWHMRNLNIIVCGGSGAGKTRFYCIPNILQASTSYVILDPKGEILRTVGKFLESKGYDIRVLDLINMERSHCYNPFVYLKNDNDVQKLVTNLFKSTTPKGSQSNDPFWGAIRSRLKRTSLI